MSIYKGGQSPLLPCTWPNAMRWENVTLCIFTVKKKYQHHPFVRQALQISELQNYTLVLRWLNAVCHAKYTQIGPLATEK